MSKNKKKEVVKELNEANLPHNRKEQFFSVIKINWRKLLLLGFFVCLFALPLIGIHFYKDLALYQASLITNQDEMMKTVYSINTFTLIFDFLGIVAIGLGISGALRVIRLLCWEIGVFPLKDYGIGIKLSWLQTIVIYLIVAIIHFLTRFFVISSSVTEIIKFLIIGLELFIFVPVLIYYIYIINIYKCSIFEAIKSAFILYVKSLPLMLVLMILLGLPFFVTFINILIVKYLVLVIYLIFLLPIILLFGFLITSKYFDKFVNAESYPEYYKKGIH